MQTTWNCSFKTRLGFVDLFMNIIVELFMQDCLALYLICRQYSVFRRLVSRFPMSRSWFGCWGGLSSWLVALQSQWTGLIDQWWTYIGSLVRTCDKKFQLEINIQYHNVEHTTPRLFEVGMTRWPKEHLNFFYFVDCIFGISTYPSP